MNYAKWLQKTVDMIEDELRSDCDLDDLIYRCHYSKTHFYRIFRAVLGLSPSEYRKKRRLSCAAVDICMTKKRILDIAVDYGFSSQEVFTRAFLREYGKTPGQLRKEHSGIKLYVKPKVRTILQESSSQLRDYDAKLIVSRGCELTGYCAKVKPGSDTIKKLWSELMQNLEQIERKDKDIIYGVCEYVPDISDEDEFGYFFGVEESRQAEPHCERHNKSIPASQYVRIKHEPDKRTLKETYEMFYGIWLPLSGLELEQADTIEIYHLEKDWLEIWIPVVIVRQGHSLRE